MATTASRPKLDPLDVLGLDHLLGDEERMIRDTVRRWVGDRVLPDIAEWFEAGELPSRELAKELGELGLLGMHLKGHGCAGASATAYGVACRELEYGDSGLRSFVSVQGSWPCTRSTPSARKEQKDKWIPKLASARGPRLLRPDRAGLRLEPRRHAHDRERDGDSYVLNGAKAWITSGSIADVAVVWAKLDGVVRGFLVEKGTKGFSTFEHKGKMSLRASVTSQLAFEDCGSRQPSCPASEG